MASIKAIEGQSVHRIQSGQVIVDLCSVAKELVENSLDAGATSIGGPLFFEVRFRDNGLDSVEVQDNGEGIPPESYESVALKHYTSKLATYADLESLQTFGFRGEALSSLCAVSDLHVITSRADEAPKGKRLEFHHSGRLKGTQVVAAQRGTTVVVQNLFKGLPVRRRELEKNIKREYGKVLGVLQAYACISTGVRFVVSNQMPNGRKAIAFATRSNQTTRENIMNVFGAKTLASLMPLDLHPKLQASTRGSITRSKDMDGESKHVRILGHITRPSLGEGRQTPDRQMFFVNKRPCALPQIVKSFNEAYKMFNVAQSPFILADLRIDANAYDVNVSPDKRTILLHDQSALLEAVKISIQELFEKQDQTMPQSQISAQKLPAFKQLSISRSSTIAFDSPTSPERAGTDAQTADVEGDPKNSMQTSAPGSSPPQEETQAVDLLQNFISGKAVDRNLRRERRSRHPSLGGCPVPESLVGEEHGSEESMQARTQGPSGNLDEVCIEMPKDANSTQGPTDNPVLPWVAQSDRAHDVSTRLLHTAEEYITATSLKPSQQMPGVVQRAYDRSRPKRPAPDTATITIGSKTITSPMKAPAAKRPSLDWPPRENRTNSSRAFAQSLRAFAASGNQIGEEVEDQVIETASTPNSDELEALSQTSSPCRIIQDFEEPVEAETETNGSRAQDIEVLDGLPTEDPSEYPNGEYFDEAIKKAQEEATVEQLIHEAEEHSIQLEGNNANRFKALKPTSSKIDSTCQLVQLLHTSAEKIEQQCLKFDTQLQQYAEGQVTQNTGDLDIKDMSAEEQLSLTVSKDDFRRMKVVGQFNLGFILAVRHPHPSSDDAISSARNNKDELFIIDQHASDEIYNFERLQAQTVVQNQPLVSPRTLDLTAIEEEIILENLPILEKNGFKVEIDDSGNEPVGKRCKLVSLPMSREVVFDTRDLEELLALLAEAPPGTAFGSSAIRPSKVRRMFAMRACRSSIMIGRTLNLKQMCEVVRHMGEMDKPWNCPHGRPTMRHLMTLDTWDGWEEGYGLADQANETDGCDDEANTSVS